MAGEPHFQLAQVNIARFRAEKTNPVNADFINALDAVNERAESADGFVWRMKGEGNDATDILIDDNPLLIINISIWRDVEALKAFVYGDELHISIMRRRKEWFEHVEFYMALWWVPAHEFPEVDEAMIKLAALADHGSTPVAFTFTQSFPAPVNA